MQVPDLLGVGSEVLVAVLSDEKPPAILVATPPEVPGDREDIAGDGEEARRARVAHVR